MRHRTQRTVWVGRGVLVAGVLLGLLAGVPAGYDPPVLFVVVVALAALLSAFRPEHLVLSLTLAAVVVWWTSQVRTDMPAAILVAAAGLTIAHVTATVLAYGPPTLRVDPRLALLWAARGALVWVAALVVWGVARAYSGHGTPALFWLTGLAAAVVGSVAAGIAMPVQRQVRP
jgi:hypothetical protein